MNSKFKNALWWPIIIILVIVAIQFINKNARDVKELNYTEFLQALDGEEIKKITLTGSNLAGWTIKGEFKEEGREFTTFAPGEPEFLSRLRAAGIMIKAEAEGESFIMSAIITWFPLLILIGVWIFFMRQMQGGGNKALSFGRSRAKLSSEQGRKVTFSDVAGVEEAKEELVEVVDFLKDPQKFQRLGGRIPKGVLLVGPPGTGKTLLARAIAGEADVPFFSISGSDFVEMFVGVGASRVRDLFEKGKKNAPCIIFIDEIDAVGRHRGAGLGGGHDEREQTLNQLLVEMDGFETNEGVILIAATNRPDVLDPALLRPGRFDRQVMVDYPDLRGREEILKVHIKTIKMADDADMLALAKGTPGFSGADLANLVNEAALLAARNNEEAVTMRYFEDAKEKVMMGPERRSRIISDKEKEITAYHEAGHAIVAAHLPHSHPIHKVTIVPRGRALGVTQFLPKEDKYNYSKSYFMDSIATSLGGRVAEEIIFGVEEITTGAGQDIEHATKLARRMVCEWGMSGDLGPLTFGKQDESIFLGRDFAAHPDYSEATALKIDKEVRSIVMENFARAKNILTEHIKKLHDLAKALLEKEVLDATEIQKILQIPEPQPEGA